MGLNGGSLARPLRNKTAACVREGMTRGTVNRAAPRAVVGSLVDGGGGA